MIVPHVVKDKMKEKCMEFMDDHEKMVIIFKKN